MKKETRILTKENAFSFINNMRYFSGMGRIKAKLLKDDLVSVTALKAAWSFWKN